MSQRFTCFIGGEAAQLSTTLDIPALAIDAYTVGNVTPHLARVCFSVGY
jgi:hypothetical protein